MGAPRRSVGIRRYAILGPQGLYLRRWARDSRGPKRVRGRAVGVFDRAVLGYFPEERAWLIERWGLDRQGRNMTMRRRRKQGTGRFKADARRAEYYAYDAPGRCVSFCGCMPTECACWPDLPHADEQLRDMIDDPPF